MAATPYPPILRDYGIVRQFGWTFWEMRQQPEAWVSDLMACHAEAQRIEAEMYERVRAGTEESSGQPQEVSPLALARARARYGDDVPEEALRELLG